MIGNKLRFGYVFNFVSLTNQQTLYAHWEQNTPLVRLYHEMPYLNGSTGYYDLYYPKYCT